MFGIYLVKQHAVRFRMPQSTFLSFEAALLTRKGFSLEPAATQYKYRTESDLIHISIHIFDFLFRSLVHTKTK